MVQRLHKLSPLWSFMFVRYSGDVVVDPPLLRVAVEGSDNPIS